MSLSDENSCIQVFMAGVNDHQPGYKVWTELAEACKEYDRTRILGITDIDNLQKSSNAFDHGNIFGDSGFANKHTSAWVDKLPDPGYFMRLITETAVNYRDIIRGRVFSNLDKACDWLQERSCFQ